MEIKPTIARMGNDVSTEAADKKTANSNQTTKAPEVSSGNAADLTLTDTAKNLLNLQNAVGKVEEVDLEKVQAIRQSIENGTYEIDSTKLTDNLIQSSLELP